MPGIVRVGDAHAGHASPTPNPTHKTSFAAGSGNVFVNGQAAVRVGDATGCGDKADAGSSTVFINGIGVHRKGDATTGHGSWVASTAASSSSDVIADGGSGGGTAATASEGIAENNDCTYYDWNNSTCLDQSANSAAPYYVA
jgi:uncharacterized Zn-binding protein involved in type VI secretion